MADSKNENRNLYLICRVGMSETWQIDSSKTLQYDGEFIQNHQIVYQSFLIRTSMIDVRLMWFEHHKEMEQDLVHFAERFPVVSLPCQMGNELPS